MSELTNGPVIDENESSLDINQLKELDDFLKCSICYEYFNTCVITECSHNFCSLCIRKYIQYKTECPICFSELYDSQLRANRIIDNFVGIFPQLKDRLIRSLRTLKTFKTNCVYLSPSKPEYKDPTSSKTPKSKIDTSPREDSASLFTAAGCSDSSNKKLKISTPCSVSQNKVIIPKIFLSPVKKSSPATSNHHIGTFVPCPVCMVEIPQRNINSHLDDCLKRSKNYSRKQEAAQVEKRAHLPKLVFRLMSTSALRAKAKEYGLNACGDNETLKNRIQKFTALYNAECDKMNPRPVNEIIRQLEKEEKILTSQKLPKSLFTSQNGNPAAKEELNALYLKENKNNFDELIKTVRRRSPNDSKEKISEPKQLLIVEPCEPSTSKAGSAPHDIFDVDEVKLQEDKSESNIFNVTPDTAFSVTENNESDDEFTFAASKKRSKRSKRLNFDSCDTDAELTESPLCATMETNIGILDALTDEDDDNLNTTRTSNLSDRSPVLQKRFRRCKQQIAEHNTNKIGLRKRKR